MRRKYDVSPTQNALINAISVTGSAGLTIDAIDDLGRSSVGVANIRRAAEALVEKGFVSRKAASGNSVRYVARPFIRRICTDGLPTAVFDLVYKDDAAHLSV